jgi:hypothetical protein
MACIYIRYMAVCKENIGSVSVDEFGQLSRRRVNPRERTSRKVICSRTRVGSSLLIVTRFFKVNNAAVRAYVHTILLYAKSSAQMVLLVRYTCLICSLFVAGASTSTFARDTNLANRRIRRYRESLRNRNSFREHSRINR